MRTTASLWALAVVLGANAALLGISAYNRWADSDAVLELTERELPASIAEDADRVSLDLRWEQREAWQDERPGWFDQAKLEELSFDCSTAPSDPSAETRYAKASPRRTYVVLEYEGEAWLEWVAREEMNLEAKAARVDRGEMTQEELDDARRLFDRAHRTRSRLFAVDAGNDPRQLRQHYGDRNRYLVTPAVVRIERRFWGKDAYLCGVIANLLVDKIRVPRRLRAVLDTLPGQEQDAPHRPDRYWTDSREPRYKVSVRYGQRLDPWIENIQPL